MTAATLIYSVIFGAFAGLAAVAFERIATLANSRGGHRFGLALPSAPPLARLPWIAAIVLTAAAPLFRSRTIAAPVDGALVSQLKTAVISTDAPSGSLWPATVTLLRDIPILIWGAATSVLDAISSFGVAILQPIDSWIPMLSVLASLALFALGTIVALRLQLRRREWRETTVDGVPVLVSTDCGPAVVGFWNGRIVLPEWLLDLAAPLRTMVLEHEREHLRARDPGLLLLAVLCLVIQPWNPALWWQVRRLRLAIEMDCDSRVLRGGADVERYGLLLLAVGQRSRRNLATVAALAEDRTFIARRIDNMTSRNDTSAVRRALLWGALAMAAVAVACNVPDGVSTADEAESPASLSSSTAARQGGDPYFEFQVEKPAELLPDSPGPRYPEMLRSAGISGRVIAQFVVGTDGLVDPGTFEVIESDHAALTQAVRGTIPHFRFTPAEIGGVKVKQHVQQPFIFQIGS